MEYYLLFLNMEFLKIHSESFIHYKKLSQADLGLNTTSHQTHIGMQEEAFSMIDNSLLNEDQTYYVGRHRKLCYDLDTQLVYGNKLFETISHLTYINPNWGGTRSPFMKSRGNTNRDYPKESTTRKIRKICGKRKDSEWYIFYFLMDNYELVIFIVESYSDLFSKLNAIKTLNTRGAIKNNRSIEQMFVDIFTSKLLELNYKILDILERSELDYEDEIRTQRRLIYSRIGDTNFSAVQIGKQGEEIIDKYLKSELKRKKILKYKWLNRDGEKHQPYDFIIKTLNKDKVLIDVKTTADRFENVFYISPNETESINQSNFYHIYRVYNTFSKPKLKISKNIKELIKLYKNDYVIFENSIKKKKLNIKPKPTLVVNPNSDKLSFEKPILLK